MPACETDVSSLLERIREIYTRLPFNRHLGIEVTYLGIAGAGLDFPMRSELIGNYVHRMLHGGVISSVLDATRGLTATSSAAERLVVLAPEEIGHRIARVGTIDLRVDYLRPGIGTHFYSSGTVMRAGRKVAVTRMELKNQEDRLIAVGTGAYLIA